MCYYIRELLYCLLPQLKSSHGNRLILFCGFAEKEIGACSREGLALFAESHPAFHRFVLQVTG